MNEDQTVSQTQSEGHINLYPFLRKLFFWACIIVFLLVILFLVYQNGKSIYDNGI